MVETRVGPSELHLKKELTSLQKSRVFRDPAAHTSWKSPLSSNPFGTNDNLENQKDVNNFSGSCGLNSGFEKRRKKVYLYNWRNHSSKSSDSGLQLDENGKEVVTQNSQREDSDNIPNKESTSDAYTEHPHNISGVKGKNPARRSARKLNRVAVTRKRINKKSSAGKFLDSESCSSQELQQSTCMLTRKRSFCLHHASPLLSGSGCANRSNSAILRTSRRREGSSGSYTPALGFSYSIGRCCDGTSASSDVDIVENIRRNQGCSLPRYGSRGMKEQGTSESDTPSRSVRNIFCGSGTMNGRRRASGTQKQKYVPKSSQGVPLLTNSFDVVDSSTDSGYDELATTFSEIDLEAASRLDGRRWSSCRSQQDELSLPEGFNSEMVEQNSLSHKCRPRSFGEIVGHNIVVQALNNAILKGRIVPAYLFQGPHGTGKTSCARIFAAALNCLSTEEDRPCGFCSECSNFSTGNVSNLKEVDASNKKDIGRMRLSLKKMVTGKSVSRYHVIVIDQCHMLSSKSWSEFMNFLEEPLSYVVFVFITVDPDILPHAVVSRCQRYHFPKIKDSDIASRLRKISAEESIDVDLDALDLIAVNSDGSLRDAETMLDQLSFLGKRITTTLVNELVGLVSNERLVDLLGVALSSNTVETVKKSRELIESGVDPVILMSQLAGLIMDIIAGTCQLPGSRSNGTVLGGRILTETEVGRLRQALKVISDAEKQLRLSSEHSTWFTAALLQLNSVQSSQVTPSRTSSRQIIERADEVASERVRVTSSRKSCSSAIPRVSSGSCSISAPRRSLDSTCKDDGTVGSFPKCENQDMLDKIWRKCTARIDSETLQHLLYAHGKLVSIAETKGVLTTYIAFGDVYMKSMAEKFLNSITDSMRIVLRHNVEVRIGLVPEDYLKSLNSVRNSPSSQHTNMHERLDNVHRRSCDIPRRSTDCSETKPQAIHEQRLESAWLQAAGRAASGQSESRSFPNHSISFKHWEDGRSDEIEEVGTNGSLGYRKEHIGGKEARYRGAISPSLLHSSSFRTNFDQLSVGYESGHVASTFCCWKSSKPPRPKVKRGNNVRTQRADKSCFGGCLTTGKD